MIKRKLKQRVKRLTISKYRRILQAHRLKSCIAQRGRIGFVILGQQH
ncbi:hypothetical protein Q7406_03930 [Glaesserella parasuis]|nr:hypothetical protein [Glaesserella parasuis]MDO9996482.1 hypothetical protein [Glaesserella parasuis]